VTDKPELQLTLKDDHSSLVLSQARAGLVARGRKDAALLVEVPSWDLPRLPLSQLRQRADAGDFLAQDELGDRYREGCGVPQDPVEAVGWYRKAAEQGNLYAFYSLGGMYERGEGVPQSLSEALRCYCKSTDDDLYGDWDPDAVTNMWLGAAELGDAKAQYLYGHRQVFYGDFGGDSKYKQQRYEEGARWLRKAAEQGYTAAQKELGRLYEDGKVNPLGID
jgi:TPR repeat protein